MQAYDVKRKRVVNVGREENGVIFSYSPVNEPGNWYLPLIEDGKNVETFLIVDGKGERFFMKFYDLLMKINGNTKVTWWNIENHLDTGTINLFGVCAVEIKKLPEWLRNADVVVIGAEDKDKISVGLSGSFKGVKR